jgi:hypothetical protein
MREIPKIQDGGSFSNMAAVAQGGSFGTFGFSLMRFVLKGFLQLLLII